ncbi:MAG: response regulator transcription factor [Acidobacteria bacterium]|nr:response regulator transcription factor [Acidobacteriota bacterium]
MSTTESIHVAIVEDDRALREGLGLLIDATPGYRCPRTYESVEEALGAIDGDAPDVLLLDIHLPGMLGSEGVKVLREKYPATQVLMLTIYAEQDKVFESICNTASSSKTVFSFQFSVVTAPPPEQLQLKTEN